MLALYSYNPKVYPHEFVLLRAEKQAPEDELILDLGWNSFAPSGLQVNTIPGNHFTIFHEPHVSFLAQVLKTCLHRDKIPNSTLITGAK
jgi:thioesterase domain-containing protein